MAQHSLLLLDPETEVVSSLSPVTRCHMFPFVASCRVPLKAESSQASNSPQDPQM